MDKPPLVLIYAALPNSVQWAFGSLLSEPKQHRGSQMDQQIKPDWIQERPNLLVNHSLQPEKYKWSKNFNISFISTPQWCVCVSLHLTSPSRVCVSHFPSQVLVLCVCVCVSLCLRRALVLCVSHIPSHMC